MADDLVIKISGDITAFKDLLSEAGDRVEGLNDTMKTATEVSAVAWAALTAEVAIAVDKYAETEAAQRALNLAMQNAGVFSKDLVENYNAMAESLSRISGIDKDQITNAQARLQSMIGTTQVSKELTTAMVNLGAKLGSVDEAAGIMGRTISSGTARGLNLLGIEIDANAPKQERMAELLDQLNLKFGGLAESQNQGLGGMRGLKTAFDDLQKVIGERFAPIFTVVIQKMTTFFQNLADNKPLLDFIVSAGVAAGTMAGIATALGAGAIAALKLKSALEVLGIVEEGVAITTKSLIGATGIGLLLIIASEIYLNWGTIWPRTQQVFKTFAEQVGAIAAGIGKLLIGAMTLDINFFKEGWAELKNALKKTWEGATAEIKPIKAPGLDKGSWDAQDADKKARADAAEAEDRKDEADRIASEKAAQRVRVLEAEGASKELIGIAKQEAALLKQIYETDDADEEALLRTKLAKVRALEEQAFKERRDNVATFTHEILADDKAYQDLSQDEKTEFDERVRAQLIDSLENQRQVRLRYARETAADEIKLHNQMLFETQKFGKTYALINMQMHTAVYEGAKRSFADLAALQQSSNATLKTIGQIAAVANIVVKTAESAMNIYAGFSTIPIIGPELGAIGAAAAVAFGAEQIGKVMGAAEGGLITGGIPGVDSVPVLAQHNELIAPAQNFEEVIGSVRALREAQKVGGSLGGSQEVSVVVGFQGDAARLLEAKFLERRRTGVGVL